MPFTPLLLGIGNSVVNVVINGLLSMPPLQDESATPRSIALYSIYNPNIEVTFPVAVVSLDYGAFSPQTGLAQATGSDDLAHDPSAGTDVYTAFFPRSKIHISFSSTSDADRRFWVDVFLLYIIGGYNQQDDGTVIAGSFLRYLADNNVIFEGIDPISFTAPALEERPEGQIFRARLSINCTLMPTWTTTTLSQLSTLSVMITAENEDGTIAGATVLTM